MELKGGERELKRRKIVLWSVLIFALLLIITSFFYTRPDSTSRTEQRASRYIAQAQTVKVALLDSGVRHGSHVKLAGSYNFTKNQRQSHASPIETGSHTHADVLANLIYTETRKQNRSNAHILLYSLKVLDSDGYGAPDDMVRALEWCAIHGMNVVNISAGFRQSTKELERAIQKVREKGAVVVAAAGNTYGLYTDFPAAYKEVLSVGALDSTGRTASYTATDKIDIYALGTFGAYQGTSLAAAYTSARIATTFSRQERLQQISKRINQTMKKEINRT